MHKLVICTLIQEKVDLNSTLTSHHHSTMLMWHCELIIEIFSFLIKIDLQVD